MDYNRWRAEHIFLLVPAQQVVGQFLGTFDDRAGTKALFAERAYTKWGDVQAATNYWSKRLAWQLARQGVQLKSGVAMPAEPQPERSL